LEAINPEEDLRALKRVNNSLGSLTYHRPSTRQ